MSAVDDEEQIPPEQVAALYRAHAENLRRLAAGIVKDHGLADEVLQTVFERLMEHSGAIREAVRGWLFRVASNEAIQMKRRQARETRAVHQIAWRAPGEDSDDCRVDGGMIRRETVARVQQAIDSLPETQQQIVRMRIYEDTTFAVIADRLGLPLGTVLTRMRLATERLQRALRDPTD